MPKAHHHEHHDRHEPNDPPPPDDGDGGGIPNAYANGPDLDPYGLLADLGIDPNSLQYGGLDDASADGMPGGGYGDGPDLDHNGVPDEVGINPDDLISLESEASGTPQSPHPASLPGSFDVPAGASLPNADLPGSFDVPAGPDIDIPGGTVDTVEQPVIDPVQQIQEAADHALDDFSDFF